MRKALIAAIALLVVSPPPTSAGAPARPADAQCSREETTKLIRSFVRALNRGDVSSADALWASGSDFQWYFVDDEREHDAEDRATLRSYFEARVALNDHLDFRRLNVSSDGTDFAFKLLRTTDDERERAAGLFHGKGGASDSVALPTIAEPIPSSTCLLTVWAMDNHREG